MFAFKCGPHSGHKALESYHHEIGGGHMHPDAGTFQLFAYGEHLIADDGYAAKFTDQQNTLLINGTGQSGEGSDWFEGVYIRRERRWPRIVYVRPGEKVDYVCGDATNAYPVSSGLLRFLRHVLFVKPDCWVIIDELEAQQPAIFELYFHSFLSFEAEGEAKFRAAGAKGALTIRSLSPPRVLGRTFSQTIRMGTIPAPERRMNALVISNCDLARQALFVVGMHSYPVSSGPCASWALECDEAGERLVLNREGVLRCFSLQRSRARADEPIVREVSEESV